MGPLWQNVLTLGVFAGLIALAVTAIVVSRREEGRHTRSSEALWHDLRRAHGLSRREVRILRRAAEKAALDPRSLIFVEPHVLMRLADDNEASRGEIQDLMSRLS